MRYTNRTIRIASSLIFVGALMCLVYWHGQRPVFDSEDESNSGRVDADRPSTIQERIRVVGNAPAEPDEQVVLQRDLPRVQIAIGSLDPLTIEWRRLPTRQYDDNSSLATDYETLRSLAESGDAEAAFQLWELLDSCRFAFESPAELQETLDTMTETQSVRLPEMESSQAVSIESSQAWREALQLSFDACSGITDEMKSEKNDWLKLASDNDYVLAMKYYGEVEQDPVAAMYLQRRRWASGDVEGMRELYKHYHKLYESGHAPELKVPAYAHLLVFKQIIERKWGAGTRRLERFLTEFEEATSHMLPHEVREAEVVAYELIAANPNCCYGN